eukprot:358308-Chlamydomonas_euryale.AAC.11
MKRGGGSCLPSASLAQFGPNCPAHRACRLDKGASAGARLGQNWDPRPPRAARWRIHNHHARGCELVPNRVARRKVLGLARRRACIEPSRHVSLAQPRPTQREDAHVRECGTQRSGRQWRAGRLHRAAVRATVGARRQSQKPQHRSTTRLERRERRQPVRPLAPCLGRQQVVHRLERRRQLRGRRRRVQIVKQACRRAGERRNARPGASGKLGHRGRARRRPGLARCVQHVCGVQKGLEEIVEAVGGLIKGSLRVDMGMDAAAAWGTLVDTCGMNQGRLQEEGERDMLDMKSHSRRLGGSRLGLLAEPAVRLHVQAAGRASGQAFRHKRVCAGMILQGSGGLLWGRGHEGRRHQHRLRLQSAGIRTARGQLGHQRRPFTPPSFQAKRNAKSPPRPQVAGAQKELHHLLHPGNTHSIDPSNSHSGHPSNTHWLNPGNTHSVHPGNAHWGQSQQHALGASQQSSTHVPHLLAVLRRDQEPAQRQRVVLCNDLPDREEVSKALAHLLRVDVDKAVVKPEAHKVGALCTATVRVRAAAVIAAAAAWRSGGTRLCELVFMVGEHKVATASVDVNHVAH